jgi:hypothetical protein
MKERRKLERFSFEVPATIEVLVSGERKETLDLPTSNICAGGAFFHTTQALPQGTKVKMDLVLSFDRLKNVVSHNRINVKVNGTVSRSESKGMAICFDENYRMMPLHSLSD